MSRQLGEGWLRLLHKLDPSGANRGMDSSGVGDDEEDSQPVMYRVYVRVWKKRERSKTGKREGRKR